MISEKRSSILWRKSKRKTGPCKKGSRSEMDNLILGQHIIYIPNPIGGLIAEIFDPNLQPKIFPLFSERNEGKLDFIKEKFLGVGIVALTHSEVFITQHQIHF